MRSWFACALALTASAGAIVAAQDLASAGRAWAQQPQQPQIISRILVEGNQRIESRTVLSYLLVKPGDPFDEERIGLSVRALGATGLFADIQMETRGNDLVVRVLENPIINRIIFEGNNAVTTDRLKEETKGQRARPSRCRASSRTCSAFSKSIAAPAASPLPLRRSTRCCRRTAPT